MGWSFVTLEKTGTCQKQCPVSQLIRMLTLVDDCTRERPAIEVDIRKADGERARNVGRDCGRQRAGVSWTVLVLTPALV